MSASTTADGGFAPEPRPDPIDERRGRERWFADNRFRKKSKKVAVNAQPGFAYVNQDFSLNRQTWLVYDAMVFFSITPNDIHLTRMGGVSAPVEFREASIAANNYISLAMVAMEKHFEVNNIPKEYLNYFAETMDGLVRGAINPKAENDGFKRFWTHYPDKQQNSRVDFEKGRFLNEKSGYARSPTTTTQHELFKACDYMGFLLNEETRNKIWVRAWDAAASMQQATSWSGLGIGSAGRWLRNTLAGLPKGDMHGRTDDNELGKATDRNARTAEYYGWIGDNYSRINLPVRQAVAAGQDFELGRAFENVWTFKIGKNTKWIFSRGQLAGEIAGYAGSALVLTPVLAVAAAVTPYSLALLVPASFFVASRVSSKLHDIGELVWDTIEAWDFRTERASPTKAVRVAGSTFGGTMISSALLSARDAVEGFSSGYSGIGGYILRSAEQVIHAAINLSPGNFSILVTPAIAAAVIAAGYETNHREVASRSGGADGTAPETIPAFTLMTFRRASIIAGLAAAQIAFTNLGDAWQWFNSTADSSPKIEKVVPGAKPGTAPVPLQQKGGDNKGGANDPSTPAHKRESPADMDPFKELREQQEQKKLREQQPLKPGSNGGQNQIDRFNGSQMGMKDAAKVAGQQLAQRFEVQLPGGRIAIAFVPSREDVQGSESSAPLRNYART